jgi:hypothetical protein
MRSSRIDYMFTTALDASGSPEHRIFVVAGFVAPDAAWDEFSNEWKERLAEDGLNYFHMREYAHSVGPWRGWKGDGRRRNRLFGDLMEIINGHVSRKFGSVVAPSKLEVIDKDLREHFNISEYSLAGRTIAAGIRRWMTRDQIPGPFRVVFAHGDEGRGKLMKMFESDDLPKPEFLMSRDYCPLQAADILAYEIFNAADKAERSQLKHLRWALGELDKLPGEPGIYLDSDIEAFAGNLRITRELNRWGEDRKLYKVHD